MVKKDQAVKARIMAVTTDLVQAAADVGKIGVRDIAKRAEVGVGTINYHFGSKDKLLSVVVGNIMADMVRNFSKMRDTSELQPIQKLKTMLNEVCNIAASNQALVQFMLTQGVLNGDMQTPLYLVPFLKEIFGDAKDEIELRIIAIQILHPIQFSGIAPTTFRLYSGIDMHDIVARNAFIDGLVDNVVSVGKEVPDENSDIA